MERHQRNAMSTVPYLSASRVIGGGTLASVYGRVLPPAHAMGTGAVEVGRLSVGAMMAGRGKTALQMTCTPVKFLAREGVSLAGEEVAG